MRHYTAMARQWLQERFGTVVAVVRLTLTPAERSVAVMLGETIGFGLVLWLTLIGLFLLGAAK